MTKNVSHIPEKIGENEEKPCLTFLNTISPHPKPEAQLIDRF